MAQNPTEGTLTTLVVGEEGPVYTTEALGEEEPVPTDVAGEDDVITSGPTTEVAGEEDQPGKSGSAPAHGRKKPVITTLALGEEGPVYTTLAVGEEEPKPTTLRLGEEGGDADRAVKARVQNTFGHF